MSSWWMGRQGLVGDVGSKSREELLEILTRQEKLLLNKGFIQTLPDKGKRISDFAEKVRLALADLEGKKKKQDSLSAIGTEFQTKYQQAFAQRKCLDSNALDSGRKIITKEGDSLDGVEQASSGEAAAADGPHDTDLAKALERVTLSEEKTGPLIDIVENSPLRNPFCATQSQKKPHYVEVLERSNVRKPRFKPNQLSEKSGSSSPDQSPGSMTPLSAEARKLRDRKHLDDITAAKLPPLHHSPAQLLSLEESVTLLQEQTRQQQVLQAKLAAKKLTEGLTVSMSNYNPDGSALAAYREVHDDGALSEED